MDAKASSILSKLQNYDYAGIDKLFSDYLHPISPLISPKPQHSKKPSKSRQKHNRKQPETEAKPEPDLSSIRSLAKTFWPFIHQSLILLPNRLSESPKHPNTQQSIAQLIDAYALCLDCLDALSSQLSGKSYSVQLQRARFVNCLFRWHRYEDAIDEGFRSLKALGAVKLEGFQGKVTMGELVPRLVHDGDGDGAGAASAVDVEFLRLIVDTVSTIVASVSVSRTKDAGKYAALLILINEVRPLFRYWDPCARNKLQLKLLACMKNAMKFLITEAMHFEGDLISEFCKVTFDEHIQLLNSQNLQDVMGKEGEDFVEFVSDTAYRCRSASTSLRVAVAMHMQQSACSFSKGLAYFSLIQRLYAIGLHLSEFCLQPNDFCTLDSKGPIHISSVWLSPECCGKLEDLCALLVSGKRYYCFNTNDYDKPLRCECGDFIAEVYPCCKVHEDSKSCISENEANYVLHYLNVLKFLCWPLAEFVNSQRKIIVAEKGESALGDALKLIHKALLEYCYLFPCCQMEKGARVQVDSIVVLICSSAFTLSLKLNFNIKGSKKLLNFLLSDNCIRTLQTKHLKNMISWLRYTFVAFYKDNQLREASKAAKLCCRASWSHCLLLCEMLVDKHKGFDGELSETLITASLNEACKISSLVVDVLHQLDSHKVEKVMVHSLDKWSLARNLFRKLPSPVALIKCWVEIQCKSYENTDASAPVLASYLMCSPCTMEHNLQIEAVGIILEQELLEYQGMHNLYPKCSQRMQMEIIDILLQDIYDSNNCRRRADILMKKGMLYRACGIGGLENCIRLLSEAIESINISDGSKAVTHEEAAAMSHQLAIIYCLRAMCTQEANPSSKDMFNDIRQAVILWLTTDIPDCLSAGLCDIGCEYVLLLLCHIADLLSIKGEMMIHLDVFNVIIRVFKRMNASLEKCLSLMWESRRFNHALCAVPLNESFITALSGHYGKDAESLDFWINSMKESQPLLVGLQQNFSYLSTLFPLAFHQHMCSLGSEISVDEVEEVASDLVSKVPMSGRAAFLAGYLYHDLSERLSASGQMIEALFCAKEAYQLRNSLFLKHFSCSIEHCEGKQAKDGISINLTVLNRIAMRAWPGNGISQNSEEFILTQWNVLRCYLESTMQVGIIHEALGNVADAEHLFKTGKSISCWLGLPAFIVAFSSCLGKTYLGRCLLDAAHMELGTAEKVLASERNLVTCSRCLLMLESSVMEQLGNLYRRGGNSYSKAPNTAAGNPYEFSIKRFLSLEKDDLAIWLEEANSAHTMLQDKVTMVEGSGCWRTKTNEAVAAPLGIGCPPQSDKRRTKTEAKRSRNMKKVSESVAPGSCCIVDCNSRVTRSRKQSSQSKGFSCTETVEDVSNSCSKSNQDCEARSVPNKVNCQKCFSDELRNYSSVTCAIQMKWEFIRRREILRLLIGLGKYEGASAGISRLHRIYSKCISVLVGGNDCKCTSSFDLEYIGKEICGDILAVERAEICYNLCWLSLRALYSKDIRYACCKLAMDKLTSERAIATRIVNGLS